MLERKRPMAIFKINGTSSPKSDRRLAKYYCHIGHADGWADKQSNL